MKGNIFEFRKIYLESFWQSLNPMVEIKYLLLTKFEVRTVSYKLIFFPINLRIDRWNLQYGPRKRG